MAPGRGVPSNRGVFCPINIEGNMHKLHIYVHRKDFKKLVNSTQDQNTVVALDVDNHRCTSTGSGRLFVVVHQLSRSTDITRQYMYQNSAANDICLFCSSDLMDHYAIQRKTTVLLEQVSLITVDKMVLSVHSDAAFEWANQKLFSTGLLINVCDQKVLVRKGDSLLTPYSSLFGKDSMFSMDMLYGIKVHDCSPVHQGMLSINSEICIIKQNNDVDFCNSPISPVKPLLMSHFTSGMINHNTTDFFLHSSPSSNSTNLNLLSLNFPCSRPPHCVDVDFFHSLPKHLVETVDEHCLIVMDEDLMAEFGLFEKCFVSIGVATTGYQGPEKETKENVADRSGQRVQSIDVPAKQHIAMVTSNACVPSNQRCSLSHVLWNNIGGSCATPEKRLFIQKWQEAGGALKSYSVPADVPYAHQIRMSLVHSPKYLPTIQLDRLLQVYFSKTRYLCEGDIVCLDTNEDPEFYQNHEDVVTHHKPVVFFKVTQVTSPGTSLMGHRVDTDHTSLFQDVVCHSFIPAFMDPTSLPFEGLSGLKTYVKQLTTLVQPYLTPSNVESPQLATFLVTGAVACGKSSVVSHVAANHSIHLMQVDCWDLCGDTPAASEARIKATLHRAASFWPCVLLLKNLHVIGKDRDGQAQDARVSAAFLEQLNQTLLTDASRGPVIVIATTSSVKQLNSDLQEGFLHQIHLESPNEESRNQILQSLLVNSDVDSGVSLHYLAQRTAGFVLGDLCAFVSQVKQAALKRLTTACFGPCGMPTLRQEQELVWAGFTLELQDFTAALDNIQSAHSEAIGAPKIPNVGWADIGGLANVKDEILDTIQLPLEHPELFAAGLRRSGVLLYGPPGTGKTLLAKAVATECCLNFLSVKGPELINMYVGQSEENVREVFSRAREASPCVIFFDELDSLAPNRGRSGDSGGVMDRVVSQLLAELDGLHRSCDVFVIGATNRPDLLDPALLRPGRFDKLLYVGVSEEKESQLNIIRALTRKFALGSDCDLDAVVERCPMNLTGADFYALCSDAMLNALKHKIERLETGHSEDQSSLVVSQADFMAALDSLVPSVPEAELHRYRSIQTSYRK